MKGPFRVTEWPWLYCTAPRDTFLKILKYSMCTMTIFNTSIIFTKQSSYIGAIVMHMICLIYCSTEHHLPTQPLQGPEELYLQWWRCLIKKMCVIPEVCVYCHLITAVCFLLHWNLWSSPRPTRSLLSNICTLLSSSGQSVSLSMELMFLHNVDRK